MHWVARALVVCAVSMTLTACGGSSPASSSGSNPSTSTGTTAPSTSSGSSSSLTNATISVQPAGTTATLAANTSVLVPAGTTVTSPDGTKVTFSGTQSTLYTQAGATITVPADATGPADNEVFAGQGPQGSATTGNALVTAIAGSAATNASPVDGTGTAAILWGGGDMVWDRFGNIIFSDRGILRKMTPAGVVTTLWGDLVSGNPCNFGMIAMDAAGNIYGDGADPNLISLSPFVTGASINELTATGTLLNLVTDWVTYTDNSAGSRGLVRDNSGNLYLTDWLNNRIVKVTPAGVRSIFAGSGASGADDGAGVAATFSFPCGLAIDATDNIYVADTGNSAVRKIARDGTVTTYANLQGSNISGPITIDPSGNIYLVGFPQSIVRLDPDQNVTTFPLVQVPDSIMSLLADGEGNVYADTRGTGAQILKISFN